MCKNAPALQRLFSEYEAVIVLVTAGRPGMVCSQAVAAVWATTQQLLPGNLLLPLGWGSTKCIEADVDTEFIVGEVGRSLCMSWVCCNVLHAVDCK
jgi:hypothetical protein